MIRAWIVFTIICIGIMYLLHISFDLPLNYMILGYLAAIIPYLLARQQL